MTTPTQRITQLASHLDPRTWSGKGLAAVSTKNDSDVVIVALGRTPQCKAGKGGLKDTPFDVLVHQTLKGVLGRVPQLDPALIQDVVVGNVRNENAAYYVRAAALAAGIPRECPSLVVNRFCSSGLMAIRTVANQIQSGEISCGLAAGVEHMSSHAKSAPHIHDDLAKASQEAKDCELPMGATSEFVSQDFNVSRADQDAYAARSHQRASAAQKAGYFDEEIFPVQAHVKEGDATSYKVLTQDDGIRHDTTAEKLAKIRPAFPEYAREGGEAATTGGNASQLTDGGAAMILMTRRMANELQLPIVAKYVATAVAGLAPRIMGIGPSLAIPKLLDLTGVKKEEVDEFVVNEAFSSMAVYVQRQLGISDEKYNTTGGSCALGHPLGATALRLVVQGLNNMKRTGGKVVVISMCVGTGQGAAGLFISEQ